MTDRERLSRIAIAFLKEARSDGAAVAALLENGQYNLAVYHAQQSVEKMLKACLAAEGTIGIYKHEVFYFFKEALGDRFCEDEMEVLSDNIPALEEEWSAARYPEWDSGDIWVPSEQYTIDDAIKAQTGMRASTLVLENFLRENHAIQI